MNKEILKHLTHNQQMLYTVMHMDQKLLRNIPINPDISYTENVITKMFKEKVLTSMFLKKNGDLVVI
jgi:hypothetical protein